MPSRELTTRPRLQVFLELDGTIGIRKRDRDDHFPRNGVRSMRRQTRIVKAQSNVDAEGANLAPLEILQ